MYGDNSRASQELWAQFMNLQGPAMQSLMQAYMEQSQKMFAQFQDQMQNQARNMFTGLSFPGFPHGSRSKSSDPEKSLRKVGFVSLGCPKALVDSERILTQLRAEGYVTAPDYAGADLVIVNTCGFIDAAVEESLDAIGEALAENGKVIVTGCLGAKEGVVQKRASRGARRHRPARHAGGDEGGARAPAKAARSLHRPGSAAGHQAHAAALRLPEDLRGLQPPLHVLHHPLDARRPGVAADRRGDAGSREPGEGGREGAARHLAGHQRVRRRREVPNRLLAAASP